MKSPVDTARGHIEEAKAILGATDAQDTHEERTASAAEAQAWAFLALAELLLLLAESPE